LSEGKFALGGLVVFAAWIFVGLPLMYHPPEANEFLGLGPHGWIAVGTLILAAVTLFLGLVGLQQIRAAREEARSNRTLTVVDRYDFDPILDGCLKRLRAAREANTPPIRGDVVTLLNYLESIAIGINKGIYDEDLAAEHMKYIVVETYKRYLGPKAPAVAEIDPSNYLPLKGLYTKWSQS
jgi:Domain of unknown function (DUF4760)